MDNQSSAGMRKRQQISQANKTMFLAITAASVVIGFALVIIVFLGQRIAFTQRVISEKTHTDDILKENIKKVPELREQLRALNTNEDLITVRLNPDDEPIQSVLDALPSSANASAMGSSLQEKLLKGVSGVKIDSLTVDPVSEDGSDSHTIGFTFAVSTSKSSLENLQKVLSRIERSIRPFNITLLSIESQGNRVVMSATGVGYYDQEQVVELREKVVK
ncbi:hypothetical protein KC953_02655 [Candidatus Saccharibacteria bacterium]|nr:hypothetical protein [Candidatus Saccharibacteria bacterium]